MKSPTKAAIDEEASLWYCDQCCASGVILLEPHIDVYSVVNALEDAHRGKAPQCDAPVGSVRVVRPNDWFNTMADIAERYVKSAVQSLAKPACKKRKSAQGGKL